MTKFDFCFPNVEDFTTNFTFLKVPWQASVEKVVAVLIDSQTKQFLFSHGSYLPHPLSLGNLALTKKLLRLLPFPNPIAGTLGNTFSCSLLGVNNVCSSTIIALTFLKIWIIGNVEC